MNKYPPEPIELFIVAAIYIVILVTAYMGIALAIPGIPDLAIAAFSATIATIASRSFLAKIQIIMPNPFEFIANIIDPPSGRRIRQQIFDTWEEVNSPWEWEQTPIASREDRTYLAVKYFPHRSTAKIPTYARDLDAGADLYAAVEAEIDPGKSCLVSTGLSVIIPTGFEMQIRSRSGLAFKHGITVLNSPGTIDAGYTGIVGILLHNTGTETYQVAVGDRVAQAVFAPVVKAQFQEISPADFAKIATDRGTGGLGSTGK